MWSSCFLYTASLPVELPCHPSVPNRSAPFPPLRMYDDAPTSAFEVADAMEHLFRFVACTRPTLAAVLGCTQALRTAARRMPHLHSTFVRTSKWYGSAVLVNCPSGEFELQPNQACNESLRLVLLHCAAAGFTVRSVDVSGSNRIDETGLALLADACADSLRSLNFGQRNHTKAAEVAVLPRFNVLEKLNLSCCIAYPADLAPLALMAHLQTLDLSECRKVDANALAHLAGLTQLRRLSVEKCPRVTDAAVAHLVFLACLEDLDLSDTKISDGALLHVGSLSALRTLRLSSPSHSLDANFIHLRRLTHLRDLKITNCSEAALQIIGTLTTLKTLQLGSHTPGAAVEHLLGLTSLEKLSFGYFWRDADAGMVHIARFASLQLFGPDLLFCDR